jgi:hypothetical protein
VQLPEAQLEGVEKAVRVPGFADLINEIVSGKLINLIFDWNLPRRFQFWFEGDLI